MDNIISINIPKIQLFKDLLEHIPAINNLEDEDPLRKKELQAGITESFAWVVERYSVIYSEDFKGFGDALLKIADFCTENDDYYELLMHLEALYADYLHFLLTDEKSTLKWGKKSSERSMEDVLNARNLFVKHMETLTKLRENGIKIGIGSGMWIIQEDLPEWFEAPEL
jgi:hypothetical protein